VPRATLTSVRPIDNDVVFECKVRGSIHSQDCFNDPKFELDSLSAFLKISRSYYANTKDESFMNENCESPVRPADFKGFLLWIRSSLYSSINL